MNDDCDSPSAGPMAGDEVAILLAVSPLALSLCCSPDVGPRALLLLPLLIALQALAAIGDRTRLRALGRRNAGHFPSWAWSALPGAYLAHRARALGCSDQLVSVWTCTSLVAIGQLAFAVALYPVRGAI